MYDDIVFQLLHMYSNKYISIDAKQASKTDNTDMQVSVNCLLMWNLDVHLYCIHVALCVIYRETMCTRMIITLPHA